MAQDSYEARYRRKRGCSRDVRFSMRGVCSQWGGYKGVRSTLFGLVSGIRGPRVVENILAGRFYNFAYDSVIGGQFITLRSYREVGDNDRLQVYLAGEGARQQRALVLVRVQI